MISTRLPHNGWTGNRIVATDPPGTSSGRDRLVSLGRALVVRFVLVCLALRQRPSTECPLSYAGARRCLQRRAAGADLLPPPTPTARRRRRARPRHRLPPGRTAPRSSSARAERRP